MHAVLPVIVGFATTIAMILLLVPVAKRFALVDRPKGHKAHKGRIPLVGGLAMFCGFFFAVLTLDTPLGHFRALFAASAFLVIIGLLDDLHHLPTWIRFAAQTFAALLITLWGGVVVEDLGPLLGGEPLLLGIWAVPFTVFATVGVINAMNMIDGLDGLAGGITLVVLGTLLYIGHQAQMDGAAGILWALTAAVAGFLVFNLRTPLRRRASVFMGDAGSMLLGLLIAWFLISFSQEPVNAIQPVTALWLFAIPLFDTVSLMVSRLTNRKSPFSADRWHLHHAFLSFGFTQSGTVAIILTLAILTSAFGALGLLHDVPTWFMFAGFAASFALYLVLLHTQRFDSPR